MRKAHGERGCVWLALGILWLAAGRPETPPPCAAPRAGAGDERRTTLVRCDGAGPALAGPARLLFGQGLDPNRADAESLALLPGLGPIRADAVVAGRPYRVPEDLLRVPGIGPVTLQRLRPWLALPPSGAGMAGAARVDPAGGGD